VRYLDGLPSYENTGRGTTRAGADAERGVRAVARNSCRKENPPGQLAGHGTAQTVDGFKGDDESHESGSAGRSRQLKQAEAAEVLGINIRSLPVPLPSMVGQRRIITRAEELLAICDGLES